MNNSVKQPEGGLLRSGFWADFVRGVGGCVVDLTQGFGVVQKLPIVGRYLYVPRMSSQQIVQIDDILELVRKQRFGWVRADIASGDDLADLRKSLSSLGASASIGITRAPHDMQPQKHLIMNIGDLSEEELLAQMKSKTRYNIRLAQKKGVKVEVFSKTGGDTGVDAQKFDLMMQKFCQMVSETAKRKGVNFHQASHYQQMFAQIPSQNITLYVAQFQNQVIAANIVTFYNGVATYLHGATSDNNREVMAPFLLQWRAICDGRERGCKYYDFGGVFSDSADAGKQGITRFKVGFAPKAELTVTAGTYDIVLTPWRHQAYKLLQKVKSLKQLLKQLLKQK